MFKFIKLSFNVRFIFLFSSCWRRRLKIIVRNAEVIEVERKGYYKISKNLRRSKISFSFFFIKNLIKFWIHFAKWKINVIFVTSLRKISMRGNSSERFHFRIIQDLVFRFKNETIHSNSLSIVVIKVILSLLPPIFHFPQNLTSHETRREKFLYPFFFLIYLTSFQPIGSGY